MNIERGKNHGGFTAYVLGIKISAYDLDFIELNNNPALAEGWLKIMARVVGAMPEDLRKQIRSIQYHSDSTWPPNPDWNPGYLIHANPDLIMDADKRQRLSDVFLRADGGHPGIGWLFPDVPWIDGKPVKHNLFPDADAPRVGEPGGPLSTHPCELLDIQDEIELWIEPVGWGAGSASFRCS
jgi:hypothetical protein